MEDQKNRMLTENQDITTKKMKRTTEHGQILMTIDNLFTKCQGRKELIISMKKDATNSGTQKHENFDNMHLSGANAIEQLQLIKQCLENFGRLSSALKDKEGIQEEIKRRKENNLIV